MLHKIDVTPDNYKKCVGILLIHAETGQLFTVEREDIQDEWELPQVKRRLGEEAITAAKRKLWETCGIAEDLIDVIGHFAHPLRYEIPLNKRRVEEGKTHVGAEIEWVLVEYTGHGDNIELRNAPKQQYDRWIWTDKDWLLSHVINFKHDVYQHAFGHFQQYLA